MSSTQASSDWPRYLYKYRCIDDKQICRSQRMFEKNELYFPTINEFNDPFDCSHGLGVRGTRKEVQEYLRIWFNANKPHLSRNERRILINKFMKKCKSSNGGVSFEVPEEITKKSTKKWRVYCLSEICYNIQMWAHYADGHKGFCLKFLNDAMEPLVKPTNSDSFKNGMWPQKVKYSDQFPTINRILDDDVTTDVKACLTKASGWSYEKEWRIVDFGGQGPRQYFPHLLKSVIFGCTMSDCQSALKIDPPLARCRLSR